MLFRSGNVSAAAEDVAMADPAGGAAAPVPDKETVLVAGLALCDIVTDPERAPAKVGVKLMLSVQLPFGATLTPEVHVFAVTAKSPPVRVVPASTNAAVPVLVSNTCWAAAATPTVVEAKASDGAETVAIGAPTTTVTPVPESDTILVAGVALWLIVSEPVRAPATVGVNLNVTAQLAPTATLSPTVHVLEAIAKSAPVAAADAMIRAAVPEFVNVAT